MKIEPIIVQLAIIFLPGLLWAGLDARYASRKASDFHYVIRAFMFGITSYGVTFGVYSLLGWDFSLFDLSDTTGKSLFTRAIFQQILIATAVGIGLAICWLYAARYKLDARFLQTIGATKTYGDEDVWDYTFNSPIASVEYAHFRDFETKLVYAGWVQTFSETDKLRELVLRDVQVFNFDGERLYETPLLYIARKPEGIHIEFPYRSTTRGADDA